MNKNFKINEESKNIVTAAYANGTVMARGVRPTMPIQVNDVLSFNKVEPANYQGNGYFNFVSAKGNMSAKHLIRQGNGLDEILSGMTDQEATEALASYLPFSVRVVSVTKDVRDNPSYRFANFQQPNDSNGVTESVAAQ